MTLFRPTLKLCELIVRQGGRTAFQASFHSGVNILRGMNSAGKSTIIDLIAYALGAEQVALKREALLCSKVLAEIECNGAKITLSREINEHGKNPISFFWGPIAAAEKAPVSVWETYPYSRSENRASFSQVLFNALELPELRSDTGANITMHQLLRILYVDQRSVHSSIFRHENFDKALVRETIGNYLCGIYDDELYSSQLQVRSIESELDSAISELRSVFAVLGRSGQETNFEWIESQILALQNDETNLGTRMTQLRARREQASDDAAANHRNVRALLSTAHQELSKAIDEVSVLELEVEDSVLFVSELDRRVASLSESGGARDFFGSIRFQFCPCCLSKIEPDQVAGICDLCKSPIADSAGSSQLARMKNELSLQIKESERLMATKQQRLVDLRAQIPLLKTRLRSLEQEYERATKYWSSPIERDIETTAEALGEVRQKIQQLIQAQKLGEVVKQLQARRGKLQAQLSDLRDRISALKYQQEDKKKVAALAIAEELKALLRSDLPRQPEFIAAEDIKWSFDENRVFVNGSSEFSESSMVYRKYQTPIFSYPAFHDS
jgi:predicted  nucleic acid-binding Zn-ribbon protein